MRKTEKHPSQEIARQDDVVDSFIAVRRNVRLIKPVLKKRGEIHDVSEALVRSPRTGEPDFRIAENRMMFLDDPTRRIDGKPDGRLLENRPDLQELHRRRGTSRINVLIGH